MGHAVTMAEWEQQQCASTIMNGGPAAVSWAPDVWRASMPSCGQLNSRSGRRSKEENDCKSRE